jgi:hypothetical protein
MDNINVRFIFIAFTILIVSAGGVFALALSHPYWDKNPLEMYPGQVKDVSFNIQNCVSKSSDCDQNDIEAIASLEEGGEIVEIINGPDYFLPFGSADENVILRVSIPTDAVVGTEYNVRFVVASSGGGEEGTIQIETSYDAEFPVVVVAESEVEEEPEEPSTETAVNWPLWIGFAIVVIVFLIILRVLRKKKEEEL